MKKLFPAFILSVLILTACTDVGLVESQTLCDAIPKETVSQVVGEPYTIEPIEELDRSTGGCKVYNTEDDRLFMRNFNIIAREAQDEGTAKSEYLRAVAVWTNGNMVNKATQDIEGIGTKAFWAYGEQTSQFITYQGQNLIILSFGHYQVSEEELLEKAKGLTNIILEEL